jgi:hypothetical protein
MNCPAALFPPRCAASWSAAVANRRSGAQSLANAAFRFAQLVAQRQAFRQRRQVLHVDTWMEESLSFAGADRI